MKIFSIVLLLCSSAYAIHPSDSLNNRISSDSTVKNHQEVRLLYIHKRNEEYLFSAAGLSEELFCISQKNGMIYVGDTGYPIVSFDLSDLITPGLIFELDGSNPTEVNAKILEEAFGREVIVEKL